MSLSCTLVRLRLPALEGGEVDGRLADHVASCLACQAEQARYRTMRRWLGEMRSIVEVAPPELSATVASSIGRPVTVTRPSAVPSMARTTVAAAAGAAVVAAAVIVGYRRSRAA